MTSASSVLSPCKVNEFLYLTGRYPDGYSRMQTLYTVLDYGDAMEFSVRDDGRLTLRGFDFPMEQNLIYKAAVMLAQASGCALGADIRVEKVLPAGGGLGGGSGNAATTLVQLNRLWGTGLSKQDLLRLGARLGADVPLFIEGGATFGEGRGTELEDAPCRGGFYVVACPSCHVPTAEIFRMPDLRRDCPVRTHEELMALPFENVFTPVVARRFPEVAGLLEAMSAFGSPRMSGSGGSCFLWFEGEARAASALQGLSGMGIRAFMARPLPRGGSRP
ncbi:MAG: 4-(cytidine 5'-diphospho)-2-C-methyl-D-erythritol kinase [Succinivibrio sp.]